MSTYPTRSSRYPNLRITVQRESKERSVREVHSHPHPTTIYYNRNRRYPPSNIQQYPSKYNQIRPLMEISNGYSPTPPPPPPPPRRRETTARGQYRNRKAELDWDHAFDLNQLDLYSTQYESDNYSMSSSNSSTDNSLI